MWEGVWIYWLVKEMVGKREGKDWVTNLDMGFSERCRRIYLTNRRIYMTYTAKIDEPKGQRKLQRACHISRTGNLTHSFQNSR